MRTNGAFVGVALAIVLAIPLAARADRFVLSNDNGGDGRSAGESDGYTMWGADNGVGENTTTLLATATRLETIPYYYEYTSFDRRGSYWDPGGYEIDGVRTQFSPSLFNDSGVSYRGLVIFNLNPGDAYGFYVHSVDSCCGRATIDVNTSVPEPATWAMVLVGLGLIGTISRGSERFDGKIKV